MALDGEYSIPRQLWSYFAFGFRWMFNLNCVHREGCHCFDGYETRASVRADAERLQEAIEENERMRKEVVDNAALAATVQSYRARLAIVDPEVAYCRKHHRN